MTMTKQQLARFTGGEIVGAYRVAAAKIGCSVPPSAVIATRNIFEGALMTNENMIAVCDDITGRLDGNRQEQQSIDDSFFEVASI